MPDIFLSYAREDQATARRFAEAFEREGFSVWWDATLNPGEAFDEVTEKALAEARAVVVLWSKHSVASRWVRAEATQARENGTLVPVMIGPCKRPIMFELTHTADLSRWNGDPGEKDWLSYLAGVRRFVKKEATGAVAAVTPASVHRGFGWKKIALVTVALLAVGTGVWMLGRKSGEQSPAATPEVTLAVLPFANLSSDPEQEYFSDGLTEEILNQLAKVKELRVTARTSSFSFKGKNEDVRSIAQKLNVANLLEGSIRKDGKNLRITAQLVTGKDGAHLWSQTYDRELSGVFALQEEIAKDVAKALSITLDVGATSRANGGTTNVEAYDKYLRAQALSRGSPNELPKGVQLLREAVALDPGFTVAWINLLASLAPMASWNPENATALLQESRAIAARLKTLPLDPVSAQAMHVNELIEGRQWSEAIAAIEPMVAAGPSAQGTLFRYALLLRAVGRANDSLAYHQRIVQLDPLSLPYSFIYQQALLATGRRTEALAEFERVKSFTSNPADVRYQEEYFKWFDEGASPVLTSAHLQSLLQTLQVGFVLPRLFATLAAKPDDVASARAALRAAFEDPANQSDGPLTRIAFWADIYGDKDLALAAIRRNIVDLHSGWVPTLWEPYQTGLRTDPRFKDIVRDMKIVDYWRASGNWGDFCKPVGKDDFECH